MYLDFFPVLLVLIDSDFETSSDETEFVDWIFTDFLAVFFLFIAACSGVDGHHGRGRLSVDLLPLQKPRPEAQQR